MKEEPLFFGSGKASFCIKRVWGLNLHVRLGYLVPLVKGTLFWFWILTKFKYSISTPGIQ